MSVLTTTLLYAWLLKVRESSGFGATVKVEVLQGEVYAVISVTHKFSGETQTVRFQVADGLFAPPYPLSVGLCRVYEKLFAVTLKQISLDVSIDPALLYPFKQIRYASSSLVADYQAILSWLNELRGYGVFSGQNDWFLSYPGLREWLKGQADSASQSARYTKHGFDPTVSALGIASYLMGDHQFELSLVGPDSMLLVQSTFNAVARGYNLSHWLITVGMVDSS